MGQQFAAHVYKKDYLFITFSLFLLYFIYVIAVTNTNTLPVQEYANISFGFSQQNLKFEEDWRLFTKSIM